MSGGRTGVLVTRFTNAGTISTRGAELDLLFRPMADLSFPGGLAYTDAKVDQFKLPTKVSSPAWRRPAPSSPTPASPPRAGDRKPAGEREAAPRAATPTP